MPSTSAGILAFRRSGGDLQVLLAHPGGPLWAHKDLGAWSIPKGLFEPDESAEQAARREFAEETGHTVGSGLRDLGHVRQRSGKIVYAFAAETDLDPARAHSNCFEMEWPPHSGKRQEFPEVDRVEWFSLDEAARKIVAGQAPFLARLRDRLGDGG